MCNSSTKLVKYDTTVNMDIRPQDLKLPGAEYHTSLGAVRTKPGRGDPTRSLSCSDKMLKWRALGMQVQK